MNHPYELLADMLHGTLDEGDIAGVQAHLDSCASCRRDFADAIVGFQAARSLPVEDPPADLVRKDGFFADQGLDAADYTSPEAVADLLVAHPRLMQRPVLVRGDRAIIGRPKDRVPAFLAGS